jgi:Thioredoxin-like
MNKEIEAKNWYQQLVKNFSDKKGLADKAQGAIKRLELEGKVLELAGSSLSGSHFDITSLRGKVVVVYYWASWNQQSIGDFARLKEMMRTYGPRGLELVCVNCDISPPEAGSPLAGAPGIQLFQPGGLESPLATQYGIMVLPNLFLVGKDGRVVSRTVQIATLEDEIKKLLK